MTVGDKSVGVDDRGRRRAVPTGRFQGRFVYTEYTTPGLPDTRYKQFVVHRVSDERYLGVVSHLLGTSWWYAKPKEEVGPPLGRQARREWAADELDAHSRKNEWCACGVSVANHDRPTRAAMRAWAGMCDPDRDVGAERETAAWLAAQHARFRRRHYDLAPCVEHARRFATPVGVGQRTLVVPDWAPVHRVQLRPDGLSMGVEVRHWIGDECTQEYVWPRPGRTVDYIAGVYEARGFKMVHDWRR